MGGETIRVSVCFASRGVIWFREVELALGSTVCDALSAVGFAQQFPEYDLPHVGVGIYGERCEFDTCLHPHDRVEVYSPLVFDPMESRRRRALHKEKKRRYKPHKWPLKRTVGSST